MSQLIEDLDVIGHLDHEPACDPVNDDCDQTASWWLKVTTLCCNTLDDRFLCHGHKREIDQFLETPGIIFCFLCGAKPAPFSIVLRPLRGGDSR
ncbi:hypothetical protein D9V41_09125 [Aeromicrobium phragmitis]|uniref:Uncharacterized protein n=1 Tax=Aeromicrobium phragmitis TaxID=2478914 RepID=A0A3L8PMP5_9ACTN|nr:hypothetical protein [Aeromicrobium phragmitis]RLV56039.1 hypothetical protein D9V41_09125 [Aeromicrobium phragmitis]